MLIADVLMQTKYVFRQPEIDMYDALNVINSNLVR